MRWPLAALLLGFALGEGVVAAHAGWEAGLSVVHSATAGLAAVGVAFAFLGLPLWLLDRLLRADGVRALGVAVHLGFSAGGSVVLASLLVCGSLGAAVGGVLWLSPMWMGAMSRRFGVALGVLLVLVLSIVLLLLAAALGHPLGKRLQRTGLRAAAIDRALAVCVPGAALSMALGVWVDTRYAIAPGMASVPLGVALLGPWHVRRIGWPALGVFAASVVLLLMLERLPIEVADTLVYRPPYVSLALGMGQKLFDADRDGAASRLLGGDCDDHNKRIHPGARERPANGIDEDCSGSDAPRYVLPKQPRARKKRPGPTHDIVILLVDAMRPDRLSLSGYKRKTSPQIDAFAKQNIWFKNAYTTAPSTRFAMASLFTGRDVRRLRYRNTGGNNFDLLPGAPTIARRLTEAGYKTVGYTVTYVMQHNQGTGQGFSQWTMPWSMSDWKQIGVQKAALTTQAVLGELKKTPPDQRLFLFAHYFCTHAPYRKDPAHDFGDRESDRYDSALAHCDGAIGEVLAALRARPNWEQTAVFVVSDHGEMLGEHGMSSHGSSLYEEDIRVAMVARVPGAPPKFVTDAVQLHWVAPTVLELAGLRPNAEDDSQSLLDVIRGAAPLTQRPLFLFTELQRGSVTFNASAVVDWPHKLIRDHRTGKVMLFNVAKDPREKRSLLGTQPRVATRLSDLLASYEAWAVP